MEWFGSREESYACKRGSVHSTSLSNKRKEIKWYATGLKILSVSMEGEKEQDQSRK